MTTFVPFPQDAHKPGENITWIPLLSKHLFFTSGKNSLHSKCCVQNRADHLVFRESFLLNISFKSESALSVSSVNIKIPLRAEIEFLKDILETHTKSLYFISLEIMEFF